MWSLRGGWLAGVFRVLEARGRWFGLPGTNAVADDGSGWLAIVSAVLSSGVTSEAWVEVAMVEVGVELVVEMGLGLVGVEVDLVVVEVELV